jgi:hypothetical protein
MTMAAEVQTAMEKPVMKQMLVKSKKEPVNCAVAQGKDTATVLLLLDKIKSPKSVLKELEKQFPDTKNGRFGTAVVDTDADPTLVEFHINKPASGMAKRLVKTLKGTGFTKVKLVFDDGSTEAGSDEEEAQGASAPQARGGQPAPPPPPQSGEAPAAPPAAAQPPDAPASPAASPPDDAAAPPAADTETNVAELTQRVTGLVKQMLGVVAADPSRLNELKALAGKAQASLKAGDLTSASDAADALEAALGGAGAAANAPAASASPAAPSAPSAADGQASPNGQAAPQAAASTLAKSRQAWLATRSKLESDIGKLHGAFMSAYKDHGAVDKLEAAFKSRVEGVLGSLDESLAEKLDELGKATDPAARGKLVQEARQIMQRYESFVASEPTIAALDTNPFVPLAIRKTLTATLTTLSKAVA